MRRSLRWLPEAANIGGCPRVVSLVAVGDMPFRGVFDRATIPHTSSSHSRPTTEASRRIYLREARGGPEVVIAHHVTCSRSAQVNLNIMQYNRPTKTQDSATLFKPAVCSAGGRTCQDSRRLLVSPDRHGWGYSPTQSSKALFAIHHSMSRHHS